MKQVAARAWAPVEARSSVLVPVALVGAIAFAVGVWYGQGFATAIGLCAVAVPAPKTSAPAVKPMTEHVLELEALYTELIEARARGGGVR